MNLWMIGYFVLCALAIFDIAACRLHPGARVMWSISILFLPFVGLICWALTRASAMGPEPEPPMLPPSDIEQPDAL